MWCPICASPGGKALETGVDIELPQPEGYVTLRQDVRDGVLAESVVDRAVARVLEAKILLGLFERPYVDEGAAAAPERPADRALARRAAEEAIVLLKNDGNLLPFNPARLRSIAVIGPNAAVCRLGGYSGGPTRKVSVLDGIRARLGDKVKVVDRARLRTHHGRPRLEGRRRRVADAGGGRRRDRGGGQDRRPGGRRGPGARSERTAFS